MAKLTKKQAQQITDMIIQMRAAQGMVSFILEKPDCSVRDIQRWQGIEDEAILALRAMGINVGETHPETQARWEQERQTKTA
jgi:hypothetical protein